jgi:Na+-translocating ferredoxin:NAD+ oxidoreductase subunit E
LGTLLITLTTPAGNGLGLGLATTVALTASNTAVSLIRNFLRSEVRLPVFVKQRHNN